jgi:AsmA protein
MPFPEAAMKKPLIILGIVVGVLLLVMIALPFLINVNQFKPTLEMDISAALGRKVEIGNIDLAMFAGGVSVQNVSIADDPAFSKSPFLTAKELTVGVNLIPLIFSKKLEVRSFTITEPQVALIKSSAGTWNFSNLGASATSSKKSGSSASTSFSVEKLKLSNGKIIVGRSGAASKNIIYEGVDLDASDLSYTTQFPFQLKAKGPGNMALDVEGKAGPLDANDASLTPLDAKIAVDHLDLATTGVLDPSAGIAGLLDFKGHVTSDGKQMSSKGTVKGTRLKIMKAGSPASTPLNIDYDTVYDLKSESGTLKQGDIHIGNALARLTGTFEVKGEAITIHMKLNAQGMPVADLEGFLPAVGVVLPSGASLKAGTLNANLTLNGPADKVTISGPVNMENGKLTGFNLGSKLGGLGGLMGHAAGLGSDTEIQKLSADVHVDPTGTKADNLNIVVPSIGTITGNGTISSSGQLDCKMVAQLAGGALNPINDIGSGLGALGGKGGKSGIPFKIQGTTSSPVFLPDVGAAAGNMAKGAVAAPENVGKAATGALGGLLGKKKPPQ